MLVLALLLAADAGSLSGKVSLTGLAPKLANLPVTRDMKVCGTSKPDETLEVKDGGIKNAVIWLTDLSPSKDAKQVKQKLDQQSCVFVPHVVAAPVGSTLDVVNSDRALHNVRAQAGDTRMINYAMPIPGHVVPTKLKRDGIFKVNCDVHPWMRAWVLILPTQAYAVTGEDGTYKIEGVPPGKHKVKVWHERLGEKDGEVEVAPEQTAKYDVEYTPR